MNEIALAEALKYLPEIREWADQTRHGEALDVLEIAARERLEMGEGERVWWCLEHEDSQSACLLSDPDEFDPWISAAHHFVKARLFLDKGEA